MIVITGAAGFIASVVAGCLNEQGREDLVLVDDFTKKQKERNFINKKYQLLLDRKGFHNWLKINHEKVDFIVHLGARTDTTEFDWNVFVELNVDYTEKLWTLCTEYQIPLVYASSAATYGGGELGYNDSPDIVEKLHTVQQLARLILPSPPCIRPTLSFPPTFLFATTMGLSDRVGEWSGACERCHLGARTPLVLYSDAVR